VLSAYKNFCVNTLVTIITKKDWLADELTSVGSVLHEGQSFANTTGVSGPKSGV